jgi:hypothetical protein
MSTTYANSLKCKLTPTELVFEFSSFFPDQPNTPPPADLEPEVRVVMNAGVLDQLLDYLSQAAKQKRTSGETKPGAVGLRS